MARSPRFGPHRYQYELGRRNYSFQTQVDDIIRVNTKRMNALMRQSIQETIDIAQTPTAKGGKMRVDTGFLRASGQSSLNGMPTGPSTKPPKAVAGQFDNGSKSTDASVQLGQLQFGSTFFFGWTANYARYREAYDGFLYAAVQRWPETVKRVTEQIRKKVTK